MKTVCILSGGMDSTTLLYQLLQEGDRVYAISFDYGQRHRKELDYASRTCERLNIEHKIVDICFYGELISCSALTADEIEVPEGHYEDESMRLTVVPNRNMVMLSIAGGYAISNGCDRLAIAVHAGDHAIYPDCRPDFIERFEQAFSAGNYEPVSVHAPFISWTKTQIVRLGMELGIDYDAETWSCYKGGEKPCGKCGTCVERDEALKTAGFREARRNGE